jgi:WD40 repeat protein
VTSVCFSPDGLRILTGSQDSTAKLWDAQTSKEILTLKGHTEEVTSVAFSSDGRYTLTGSRDGTAIVWLAEEWRNQ